MMLYVTSLIANNVWPNFDIIDDSPQVARFND